MADHSRRRYTQGGSYVPGSCSVRAALERERKSRVMDGWGSREIGQSSFPHFVMTIGKLQCLPTLGSFERLFPTFWKPFLQPFCP
jgi:hypothetical protein